MLLIIDNYDSFTYNLAQYFQCLGQHVVIYQHDKISLSEIELLAPRYIVISPGPNSPDSAGISLDVIKHFYKTHPLLGICLGHQCLAHAFGGKIIQAPQIIHGKATPVTHDQRGLFRHLPTPFLATRYHSLAVDPNTLPDCFTIDAWSCNTIMAITHRQYPVFGVQFHPEAILSEHGFELLSHFLEHGY